MKKSKAPECGKGTWIKMPLLTEEFEIRLIREMFHNEDIKDTKPLKSNDPNNTPLT